MKMNNDYKAKLKMWARNPRVVGLPKAVGLPAFSCHRFSSAEEMNRWKRAVLSDIARKGGVQWTK